MKIHVDDENELKHYGVKRRSGRYPYGSGDNVPLSKKNSPDFFDQVKELRREGMTETEISRALGFDSSTDYRAYTSMEKARINNELDIQVRRLKATAMSNVAIGEELGIGESRVRSILAKETASIDKHRQLADFLKEHVDSKGAIDVGEGVELHLNVSKERLKVATAILEKEGYNVHNVKMPNLASNGNQTTTKVIAPPSKEPGKQWAELHADPTKIKNAFGDTQETGKSVFGLLKPMGVDAKRIAINYAEDGGADADGAIYVRPGVKDLSLGGNQYAQVRINVNDTHYLKGMAVYKSDLPKGVDIVFNTDKSKGTPKLDVMKPLKRDSETGEVDWRNPFGSVVRQLKVDLPDGTSKLTSAMNIVNDEADWLKWSKNLPSQFLSKQSQKLAKTQLDEAYAKKREGLDELMSLTNPVVKKKLLESYGDDLDSASVKLKASPMSRQATQVLLPIKSLKDTEVYAPNFKNGERVVLVRFPHGGTFEIPELKVNNRNAEGKSLIGNEGVAIGINSRVASKLSGADFDGDTALVIPNNSGSVRSSKSLEGLKDFNPKVYKMPKDSPKMSDKAKGAEMGKISNLITDMTLKGAKDSELAAAVRHSMVVIDAQKHDLDYKQSARDNNIAVLKERYQGSSNSGASTLISRAKSEERVPHRAPRLAKDGGPIDKDTGERVYRETGQTYYKKVVDKETGKVTETYEPSTTKSTKLAEAKDARKLSSGTKMEDIYADHSNKLKAMANEARRVSVNTPNPKVSPSAKAAYKKEVARLNDAIKEAYKGKVYERQAQALANTIYKTELKANPDMEPAQRKKIKAMALAEARNRTGASRYRIEISDREWEAIQAGAISSHRLSQILSNTDLDRVKELAMPRTTTLMTSSKTSRARAMLNNGLTQAEVADALGVSLTTLKNNL